MGQQDAKCWIHINEIKRSTQLVSHGKNSLHYTHHMLQTQPECQQYAALKKELDQIGPFFAMKAIRLNKYATIALSETQVKTQVFLWKLVSLVTLSTSIPCHHNPNICLLICQSQVVSI